MTEKKPDRRKERTFQMLSGAMLELLKERDYPNITIQDIADRANVSRATFYLHFKDKDELLFKSMERIYDQLSAEYPPVTRDEFINKTYTHNMDNSQSEYTHVAANAEFYKAMFGTHGSPQFMQMVRAYLENVTREHVLKPLAPQDGKTLLPLDFIAAFTAGAEIGVINWWLDNDLQYSPEQINQMMSSMCMFGMAWALKLPVDPNDIPT